MWNLGKMKFNSSKFRYFMWNQKFNKNSSCDRYLQKITLRFTKSSIISIKINEKSITSKWNKTKKWFGWYRKEQSKE